MSQPTRLTSMHNPRVKAVVRLREAGGSGGRRKTGLFIAEGSREVERALAAGLAVRELYVCPELPKGGDGSVRWRATAGVAVTQTSEAVFRKMANLSEPEGVLAVVEQPRWSLEALPPVTPRTLLLVAVGTQKPGNLGAMVRTAEAAGCEAVIAVDDAGRRGVDPMSPQAIRNSTCAVFSLPTISATRDTALAWLGDRRVRLVAATPAAATVHTDADLGGPVAIVIGPEDTGLSQDWLDAADLRVAIPMRGRLVDSLNASSAAAVLLFEALRQRSANRYNAHHAQESR